MSDHQYSKLNDKIDNLGDQILKLYQHMETRFSELDDKIAKRIKLLQTAS